ncbi:BREX system P-loop protein BrxC [Paratractidigestivibacter sp.]|uniref:BREX system P-loop protein BrxC n=2 Tax=Paratractidigestivibacter sp. TaxID=2847316 RepID=UPI002ABE3E19|nr:BREX system P-loop protein BrxC [Paratractidigestivibacter sp.]
MRIYDMFERDIDRDINGVIKMDVADEDVLEQELSEYVVTRELARHFKDFYAAYCRALDRPTDKIGVWISGFFGSGKSHFLKMLSYLLSNQQVKGIPALDYFNDKFEDPETLAAAQRAASVPTETILFNIDLKAQGKKDEDVIKRTFASVFYEHLGFYGHDLRVAELEMLIDEDGKTDAFRSAYQQIADEPWSEGAKKFKLRKSRVKKALVAAGVMDEAEAESWFADKNEATVSIETFVDQVKRYVDAKAAASPCGEFRLLIMVDEIGQFIGDEPSLMLNLQTIVEELGTRCAGRVWVVVTSQEAIDSVTTVVGNDFSKIQGRFNTRLSMSSSNVDEVIKRRVLAKTPAATEVLEASYGDCEASLKNLFSFKDSAADLIGYDGGRGFAEAFPFAEYQFKLVQDVLNELRKQGNSGKHTSSGERSMLNGFQEAAQSVEELDQNSLVPLWRFYDTVQSSLESFHRQVINRAAEAASVNRGLEPYDVEVLKLLFLIRWVARELPGNLDNIVTLMVDDSRVNRADLRERVTASLDRLVEQNYVARDGETYQFLTDVEQGIAMKIQRTEVEPDKLSKKAADIMFGMIFDSPKLTVGKNVFPIAEYLDERRVHDGQGMTLRVIAGMDGAEPLSREKLQLRSSHNEAIVALSPDVHYYDCLLEAAKIEKFCNVEGIGVNEAESKVIAAKQDQRTRLERQARELMEQAVLRGEFYVLGSSYTPPKSTSAKTLIEECAKQLVGSVYSNLEYIEKNLDSDADVRKILTGKVQGLGDEALNHRAAEDLATYLSYQAKLAQPVTMGSVQRRYQAAPYGWREIDIAGVAADLVAQHRAKLTYAGAAVSPDDPKAVDYLRKTTLVDKVRIEQRTAVSEAKRSRVRTLVEDLTGEHNILTDEDGLAKDARRLLTKRRDDLSSLLSGEYRSCPDYPGYSIVVDARKLLDAILQAKGDSADFLQAIANKENDLADAVEDLEDVDAFFKNQRKHFDRARQIKAMMTSQEREYLAGDAAATKALDTIDAYLANPRLGGSITQVVEANNVVTEAHDTLLHDRQTETLDAVDRMYQSIESYAAEKGVSLGEIGLRKAERKNAVHAAKLITELDAVSARLKIDQSQLFDRIEAEHDKAHQAKPANPDVTHISKGPATTPAPKEQIKRLDRNQVFLPKTLKSAEEVDDYLAAARERLLRGLEGNDGIKLG